MYPYPSLPDVADAPADLLDRGHLWLQEWVAGALVRFRVDETGVTVGDHERVFDRWEEPLEYRHVARHVRERFDREAFLAGVDAPGEHVFVGTATRDEGVTYDWDRLPSFLGWSVHSADRGFLPPDAAERAFDRLGLAPLNAFEKEVATRDFRLDRYEVPASTWYEGPAAGVLLRNKRGEHAVHRNPDCEVADAPPRPPDVLTLVESFVTPERVDHVAAELGGRRAADVGEMVDRLVEALARERYRTVVEPAGFDVDAFRAATAERVARSLRR